MTRDAPAAVGDDGRRGAVGAARAAASTTSSTRGCGSRSARSSTTCAQRGDAAVCDALARFDGIDLAPGSAARRRADELAAAAVERRRSTPRSTTPSTISRGSTEQQMERGGSWQIESEPGLTVGENGHADQLGRPVHPVGQGRATRASPTSWRCRRSSPACRRSPSSSRRFRAAPARSTLRCSWCAASSASPTCSASTDRPASPRSDSAPNRSPVCARSSAPARRRSRSPRSRCNGTASPR